LSSATRKQLIVLRFFTANVTKWACRCLRCCPC